MQPCQAQMPSVRLKIAVVGTGGVLRKRSAETRDRLRRRGGRSPSHRRARRWSPSGRPANGLPSVITERTRSGIILASWRA